MNGLFPYSPGYILVFAGVILMFVFRKANRSIPLLLFILMVYICASWHSWFFGCSFGMRSFVDFSLVFTIPIAFLTEIVLKKRNYIYIGIVTVLFIYSAYFTIRLSHQYTECFFGHEWDWREYFKFHSKANIFPFKKHSFDWTMDKDNDEFLFNHDRFVQIQKNDSVKYVTFISHDQMNSAGFIGVFDRFSYNTVNKIHIGFSVLSTSNHFPICLVCEVIQDDSLLYSQSYSVCNTCLPEVWNYKEKEFQLPYFDPHQTIRIFFQSETRDTILIDDVSMKFFF